VVVAQNLKRVSQVRWLVVLLVLSGFTAALYTGWQYTYGLGVRLVQFSQSSKLAQDGLRPNDLLVSFDGHSVHSAEQLVRVVRQTTAPKVAIEYVPGLELRSSTMVIAPKDLIDSGLDTPAMKLARGKPFRAQGTLGHYVIFAEMLTQIGCMAWALLLSTGRGKPGWLLVFGVAFAGIAAALLTTETRAAVGGLLLGCVASLLYFTRRKTRVAAIALLIAILAGALVWIQHSRRIDVLGHTDPGTNFRVLMWEDGTRLVREHPWFGVGMETVRVHFREWNIRGFMQYKVQSHFHSTFLQIAVERGIPALLAWLWFCVAYFLFLLRLIPRLRARSRFACGVAVGALAGLLAFTFTSFFHYNLGEESLAMIFFFYFGLAVALDRLATTPSAMDVH
jgi:O-Antigen ligase/PDZ domain